MINAKFLIFLQLFAAVYSAAISSTDEVSRYRSLLEKSVHGQYREPLTPELGNLQTIWSRSGKFEGDILLTPEQIEERVQGFAGVRNSDLNPKSLWPNKTLFYDYNVTVSAADIVEIEKAIAVMNKSSCVVIKKATPFTQNFVRFQSHEKGCFSIIGRYQGAQKLNLGVGCISRQGTIIHEILHALGFHHMQSTHNRDEYVTVVYEKIKKEDQINFVKRSATEVSNLGFPYEYGSLMHYGLYDFSIDGNKTMIALKPTTDVIGQYVKMSDLDVKRLKKMYSCP